MRSHRMRAAKSKFVPVLTWHDGDFNTTTASSHTYTLDIGTASGKRYVVVGLSYRIGATTVPDPPSVTVGGQSTSVISANYSTSTASVVRVGVVIYRTVNPVTTGTTASVVVTTNSANFTRSFVSSYSLSYENNPTTLQTANQGDGTTNPVSVSSSLKTASNVGLVVASGATSSALTGISATGDITTDYNSGVQSLGALLSGTVTGTGTITITATGTGSNVRAALALWG